jgi:hypothetical protein
VNTVCGATLIKLQQCNVVMKRSVAFHEVLSTKNPDFLCVMKKIRRLRIKMAVFLVVAPCSLVEVYELFRGPCCKSPWGKARPGRDADHSPHLVAEVKYV